MDRIDALLIMEQMLSEYSIFYYQHELSFRYKEYCDKDIHSSWEKFRSISNPEYETLYFEYEKNCRALNLEPVNFSQSSIMNNEDIPGVIIAMTKPCVNPLTWPQDYTELDYCKNKLKQLAMRQLDRLKSEESFG